MTRRKLSFYSFIGLLFSSVLLKKLLPIFIILLFLVWISERNFAAKWETLKKQRLFLFLPGYFLLLLLGMTYSENLSYGFQKMETRLPLLLLPIVLPTLKSLNFVYHRRIFARVFVTAILIAALICFIRATYFYILETAAINRGEDWEYFYRSKYYFGTVFSNFLMHPGYLAMYANVAILILLYDFKKLQTRRANFLRITAILLLVIFVLMLYSKTGIALLFFVLLAFGVRYAWLEKKISYFILSFTVVLSLSVVVFYFVPTTQTHTQIILDSFSSENHNPDSVESTQLRIHAWQASKNVMEEHILLGHGTGDVWDVLSNEYKKQGYNGALLKEVNAHNEFYQTGLAIGLVGIIYLILMLAALVFVAVRKRHFPLLLWTLITAIAFFFESYFSTQDGVIYTSLFLFFVVFLKNDRHE